MLSVWLDAIFSKFEWYNAVKQLVINAIIAAEITNEEGALKKQKAIDGIYQALKDLGLDIPKIPDFVLKWLISLLIDLIVNMLNVRFGKDWINKIQEILKFE